MRRQRRRGANAIEFALVMPLFLAMLAGMVDYGWYFWREARLVNGIREAVRAGGMQTQLENESTGACSSCVSMASTMTQSALKSLGYKATALTPKLERVPATGSPCVYTLKVDGTVPHTRLFPIVPGPSAIKVSLLSVAQNLTCN